MDLTTSVSRDDVGRAVGAIGVVGSPITLAGAIWWPECYTELLSADDNPCLL